MAQINKPTDYFNTKLYTGTGAEHNITGVGFQPDWTWIKERNSITSHRVFDIIRGATVEMFPDLTDGESSDAQSLKSFDSDGFTLGTDGATNGNSDTYASWNWLASNTTASNTDGSITSTVSANTTSGFSIVSWTGSGANATIGHGLGVAPKFLIVKNRSSVTSWGVQTSTGAGFEMNLNNQEGQTATSVYWNSTDPTSSVFSVGTNAATNNSGDNMIAYCFAPIKGFSKMGTYTGNGNADGTFVYTGFKPAFLLTKKSSAAGDSWNLLDATRNPNNAVDKRLTPDTSDAEATTTQYDFLSNGFKARATTGSVNTSGATYIYMAFAENPFVSSNKAIPATAR
jgi:hypothetical protein